ncbi:unnamed protein product [Cuscuta epithymum]|uniref:Zinc finger GRF-type domain-containing protein n=1 Tax=Cuscuta epithymum TaxID=186058 RepID=A0AAV0EH24_9ASTE|nr:unnamed protein product [Cuscuta epithymum]
MATSSSSTSTARRGRNFTLDYDPAVFCFCGLKAPLCVSRQSGSKFYGCQKWKVHGCGFFSWADSMDTRGVPNVAGMNENTEDLKVMVSRVGEQLTAMQGQLNGVRRVVQAAEKDSKMYRKLFGFGLVVVIGLLGMLYCKLSSM